MKKSQSPLAVVFVVLLSLSAYAQGPPMDGPPPWMRGGPEGGMRGMRGDRMGREGREGRNRPGGREGRDAPDDAQRNERFLGMLRGMDRNGNGKLEPDEIPEYRRNFVNMVVTRMGGDPSKTIDLNALASRASSSGQRPSGTSTTATSSALPSDPLVPYFGEKEEATTPVLEFGRREPAPKAVAASSARSAEPASQADQILRQAREIMNKYDKNKNGTLDKDKGEWVSALPVNADKADKNRDGRISMSELIEALGGRASSTSSGAAAVSTRQSSAYDRLPPGVPDWFFERDKNQDGQLTMMEYAGDKPWTEAIADEFRFLDKNNDGVATITEVFDVLKGIDEEKRLKEEQAKREKERRRGGAAVPADTEKKDGEKPAEEKKDDAKPEPAASPGAAPTEVPATAPYAAGSEPSTRGAAGGTRPSRRGGSRR